MASDRKLPKLLGWEQDIRMNEKDISDKISANFKQPADRNSTSYQNKDNPNFLEFKKTTSFPKEGKLIRLNSSDVYEITGKGKIRAIHSNESIATAQVMNPKARPKSGSYQSRRPWSNRSYRKQTTVSSLNNRPISGKRKIFSWQKSNSVNTRQMTSMNRMSSHLSKIDDIIGQVDIAWSEIKPAQKMPRKYTRLGTQDNLSTNTCVYGKSTLCEKRKIRSSVRSTSSNLRDGSCSSAIRTQNIEINKPQYTKCINGVSIGLLTSLFHAKCKDLEL